MGFITPGSDKILAIREYTPKSENVTNFPEGIQPDILQKMGACALNDTTNT